MNIYQRAKLNGCHFESTCIGIPQHEYDRMMKGTRLANKRKVVKIALMIGVIDETQAKRELKDSWYNPFNHYVSKDYIVYTHSDVNYFIKVF